MEVRNEVGFRILDLFPPEAGSDFVPPVADFAALDIWVFTLRRFNLFDLIDRAARECSANHVTPPPWPPLRRGGRDVVPL